MGTAACAGGLDAPTRYGCSKGHEVAGPDRAITGPAALGLSNEGARFGGPQITSPSARLA